MIMFICNYSNMIMNNVSGTAFIFVACCFVFVILCIAISHKQTTIEIKELNIESCDKELNRKS